MNKKLIKISETIRDHLIQQNKPSEDSGMCAYRSNKGLKCAVGCLITDENYSSVLEHKPARDKDVRNAVEKSTGMVWSDELSELLMNWQNYHDTSYFGWVGPNIDETLRYRSPSETHELMITGKYSR